MVTCRRDGAPFIFQDSLNFPSCYKIDVTGHIINSREQLDSDILLQQSQLPQSYDLEIRTLPVVPHYQKKIKRIFKTCERKRRTAGEKREAKRQRKNTTETFESDTCVLSLWLRAPSCLKLQFFIHELQIINMSDSRSRLTSSSNFSPTIKDFVNTSRNALLFFLLQLKRQRCNVRFVRLCLDF